MKKQIKKIEDNRPVFDPVKNGNLDKITICNMVEELVKLRAEKDIVDSKVKFAESTMKKLMVDHSFERAVFKSLKNQVTINKFDVIRKNWQEIAMFFNPSDYMLKKHSKVTKSTRLTVGALPKQDV